MFALILSSIISGMMIWRNLAHIDSLRAQDQGVNRCLPCYENIQQLRLQA